MSFDTQTNLTTSNDGQKIRFDHHAHLCNFLFAGNSTFTLVSKLTGTRYTYRVSKPQNPTGSAAFFVSVLTGSSNERDYTYLGHIYRNTRDYAHGKNSQIRAEAPSAKGFVWFYTNIVLTGKMLEHQLEIWHEGRCGRCNRKLTVPQSIASGIGPDCAQIEGVFEHAKRFYVTTRLS